MRELQHGMAVADLMNCNTITNHTDVASKYADRSGFGNSPVTVLVNFGALTNQDGSNYVLAVLQEAEDGENPALDASYAACAAGDVLGAFTAVDGAADDDVTQKVTYIGKARYIRVKLDFTSAGSYPDACPVAILACIPTQGTGTPGTITTGTSTG
jgi:hypothetical protein